DRETAEAEEGAGGYPEAPDRPDPREAGGQEGRARAEEDHRPAARVGRARVRARDAKQVERIAAAEPGVPHGAGEADP
ncbi:unnamed protein product, partial [Prorocentrum cordatum]